MKFSTTFILTLLTGALAAPRAVDVDSEERGVAARDFQDSLAEALDAGEVKTSVLLTERDDVSVEALDVEEDDGLEARGAKKAKAQAKGKGRGKGKGQRRKGKGKTRKAAGRGKGKGKGRGRGKGKGKGKRNGKGKKNNAKAGKTKDAAAPRVTSSFDAPGVVDA